MKMYGGSVVHGDMDEWREMVVGAIRASAKGNQRVFDREEFPWMEEVEAEWASIRQEFDSLTSALNLIPGIEEVSRAQSNLTNDGRWKIFPFCGYGYENVKNQERCPRTARALAKIPGLKAAMFSILQPGKEIPPHYGAYCGVLRYHLGVKVPTPQESCGISVGGEVCHWNDGESLVFDDTHLHFAWNRSCEDRVVLLVDFARPLDPRLSDINERIINSMAAQLVEGSDKEWARWELDNGEEFDRLLRTAKE